MNDNSPTSNPNATTTQPPAPSPVSASLSPDHDAIKRSNKQKLIWGLVCLLGPTLLLILSIALYAITSLIASTTSPASTDNIFGSEAPIVSVMNVILFLSGVVSILTWLPGIILGIILLVTRRKLSPRNQ